MKAKLTKRELGWERCDICGRRVPYGELSVGDSGWKVCDRCYDEPSLLPAGRKRIEPSVYASELKLTFLTQPYPGDWLRIQCASNTSKMDETFEWIRPGSSTKEGRTALVIQSSLPNTLSNFAAEFGDVQWQELVSVSVVSPDVTIGCRAGTKLYLLQIRDKNDRPCHRIMAQTDIGG